MLFPPLLTSSNVRCVWWAGKNDSARPIRLRQRLGGAHQSIAHRRPFGEIGRHFNIDGTQALSVEQTKTRVKIAGVCLRLECQLDDGGVGHVEIPAIARVKPEGGCVWRVMNRL